MCRKGGRRPSRAGLRATNSPLSFTEDGTDRCFDQIMEPLVIGLTRPRQPRLRGRETLLLVNEHQGMKRIYLCWQVAASGSRPLAVRRCAGVRIVTVPLDDRTILWTLARSSISRCMAIDSLRPSSRELRSTEVSPRQQVPVGDPVNSTSRPRGASYLQPRYFLTGKSRATSGRSTEVALAVELSSQHWPAP